MEENLELKICDSQGKVVHEFSTSFQKGDDFMDNTIEHIQLL